MFISENSDLNYRGRDEALLKSTVRLLSDRPLFIKYDNIYNDPKLEGLNKDMINRYRDFNKDVSDEDIKDLLYNQTGKNGKQ